MGYWDKKDEMQKVAKAHTLEMENKFKNEIAESVKQSKIYDGDEELPHLDLTKAPNKISVRAIDTVSAAITFKERYPDKKVALLNFASYKHPGGAFLGGSTAQEECLCHESFLYNVLVNFEDSYYRVNSKDVNDSLYYDKAIYSPNVKFIKAGYEKDIDVITCAAPNWYSANKYKDVDPARNEVFLEERIKFIAKILKENKVDIAILGAFGCGVFAQDPYAVAKFFDMYVKEVDEIIYAIPKGANYDAFVEVIVGER